MDLSVVVPTLDGRDRLPRCLGALTAHASDAEVIVVNGPSTDGTSGYARDHSTVDHLLEVAERDVTVARNAGLAAASGGAVALLGDASAPEAEWALSVRGALRDGADAVTGPVHRSVGGGLTTETVESRTYAGRSVTFFDGGNVAFSRTAVDALDGFDEYLPVSSAADAAHRLAGMGYDVAWHPGAAVLRTGEYDTVDRLVDVEGHAWGLRYRARSYALTKNYGLRPGVVGRLAGRALLDGLSSLTDVARGQGRPTAWVGDGRAVLANVAAGTRDGLRARRADSTPRRNPNGVSSRSDRVVARVPPVG